MKRALVQIMLFWIILMPSSAGNHWVSTFVILASVPTNFVGLDKFPEQYHAFEAERKQVETDFAQICPLEAFAVHTPSEILSQPDFKLNYWILVHDIPYAYLSGSAKKSDRVSSYIQLLKTAFPECGDQIYAREAHIYEPTIHYSCDWAQDHDQELYAEICQSIHDVMLGEDVSADQ